MARTSTRDLTNGSPMRLILSFAAPLLFGFLFQQFYSFVDTAIVGKYLGAAKLAAVGGTGSVNFLVLGFCQGSCSGFAIPIARSFGAGNSGEVRRYTAASVWLSAALSVSMAILTGILCPAMLRLMNTPETIIADSVSYIRIIFLGIPVTILYNMASGVLRSLGDSKTPVIMLIVASLVNVVLDLVLILLVHMDVAGAAVATLISQLVSGIGCLLVIRKRFPILKISREEWRLEAARAKELLGTGVPMGLQFSITAIGSVVVQWSVNSLGVSAVAAVAAAGKLSMFFCCVFDALATTMATFSGQNIGACKPHRIQEGLKDCSIIGTVYCLAAYGVILFFGQHLLSLFVDGTSEPQVMDMALRFIRLNGLFYIPLLFVNILRLTIQGMGFTRVAMFAGVFEMVARTLVALLLVPVLGFTGACLANPAAWIMADLFLIPCYRHSIRSVRQRLNAAVLDTPQGARILPFRRESRPKEHRMSTSA